MKITQIDLDFAKLVCWGVANLSQREKDLIYVFENYQRAQLTKKELSRSQKVSPFSLQQMKKVQDCLTRLKIPFSI